MSGVWNSKKMAGNDGWAVGPTLTYLLVRRCAVCNGLRGDGTLNDGRPVAVLRRHGEERDLAALPVVEHLRSSCTWHVSMEQPGRAKANRTQLRSARQDCLGQLATPT